jgi:hypothetical protein
MPFEKGQSGDPGGMTYVPFKALPPVQRCIGVISVGPTGPRACGVGSE